MIPKNATPRLAELYSINDPEKIAEMFENGTYTEQDIRAMYREGFKLKAWMRATLDEQSDKNKVFFNVSDNLFEWQTHSVDEVEGRFNFYFCKLVSNPDKSEEWEYNKKMVLDWLTIQHKCMLMLRGTVGSGKTSFMNTIFELLNSYKIENITQYREKRGPMKQVRIEARSLFEEMIANASSFEKYMNVDLLAIDDFGQESKEYNDHGNKKQPIERLLSERQRRNMKTIITTNLANEGLHNYGDRLYDRIKGSAEIVGFIHQSYRQ